MFLLNYCLPMEDSSQEGALEDLQDQCCWLGRGMAPDPAIPPACICPPPAVFTPAVFVSLESFPEETRHRCNASIQPSCPPHPCFPVPELPYRVYHKMSLFCYFVTYHLGTNMPVSHKCNCFPPLLSFLTESAAFRL